MVAMVKGVNLRGYERVPFGGVTVVGNDDNLVLEWKEVYVGSLLIGYVGKSLIIRPFLPKGSMSKTLWVKVGWKFTFKVGKRKGLPSRWWSFCLWRVNPFLR